MADFATIMKMMDDQIKTANQERAKAAFNGSSSESMLSLAKAVREAFSGNDSQSMRHDRKLDIPKPSSRAIPRNYPPPVSSLGQDGKPLYFLKSVRGDGRLVIKMFKHDGRPSYVFGSPENGRRVMKMFKYPPPWLNADSCRENVPLGTGEPDLGDGNAHEEEGSVGVTEPELGDHAAEEDGGAADCHAVEG